MLPITLDYGAVEPLVLEMTEGTVVDDCRGPEGAAGEAARELVAAAIASPADGPPLEAHVVPGDRVVVAVAGELPQRTQVVAAVVARLGAAGVSGDEIGVLRAAPLDAGTSGPEAAGGGTEADPPEVVEFDPGTDAATSYLAADEAGMPLYLSRALVDADVVVAVGPWGWNAALGGRSLEGELWPAFSRQTCRQSLTLSLAKRGRQALGDWRTSMQEIAWRLGVCASLRLVPGRRGTLHAACFGLPDEAGRRARDAAAAWCPRIDELAELSIASLANPQAGFEAVTRAVAAAARVTQPGGTICVASQVTAGPGIIFLRWRQGAPLDRLVHEAVQTRDPALIADALQTRLFARALGDRRLVLLSALEEATVEELEFGFAGTPDVVERLAHRAESVAVLHEADLMLPQPRG